MADSLAAPLAGVALAAGAGTRLMPLTRERPKPLCPVGDRALLDWSLEALRPAVAEVAVNAHHRWEQIRDHLQAGQATVPGSMAPPRSTAPHLSIEHDGALGTAGALGALRGWLDGRGALVVNADTWHRADLSSFVAGWDGERVRLLTSTTLPFGPRSAVVASLLPWSIARTIEATPAGLWERVWRAELDAGRLDAVHHSGVVVDCATPRDYLAANLAWSGGETVVGSGAVVEGSARRCVLWPGSRVHAREHLVDAVRTPTITVLVR
ncbi:MAG: NDP-sugar synthase [Microthrixaceae bacterium]